MLLECALMRYFMSNQSISDLASYCGHLQAKMAIIIHISNWIPFFLDIRLVTVAITSFFTLPSTIFSSGLWFYKKIIPIPPIFSRFSRPSSFCYFYTMDVLAVLMLPNIFIFNLISWQGVKFPPIKTTFVFWSIIYCFFFHRN